MAYISQNDKKELAPAIKVVLKRYGVKGTISIRHHSTLVVNIKSGSLDIIGNWFNHATKFRDTNEYGDVITKPDYINVNEYWVDYQYTGIVKDFLNELVSAMKGENFFDKTDLMSDYFHVKHYLNINVGKWDNHYTVEG